MSNQKWTDEQIQYVINEREGGKSFIEISQSFNKKYKEACSDNLIKKTYYRYRDADLESADMIKNMKVAHRAAKAKGQVLKENRKLIETLVETEDLFIQLKEAFSSTRFTKPIVIKPKVDKNKKNATLEIMLTDLHYGRKSKEFNAVVARQRMKSVATAVMGEITRYSKLYNITEIITFLGGDIIENADFHGKESQRSSESTTSEQTVLAITSLYEDYFVPVCSTGIKQNVVCITGNHDRPDPDKSFNSPGELAHTWVIYHSLKLLLKDFKHVKFDIESGVFHVRNIYDSVVLYEHGDYIHGGLKRVSLESHMAKRSKQINKIIDFLRMGHFHEYTQFGRGKIIVNASLAGQDSYSEINGYSSEASQTINIYVETENRPNSFYHSFPIYLK